MQAQGAAAENCQQHDQRAAMRDHDMVPGATGERAREQPAAVDQGGGTLGAGTAAADRRARPGVDRTAWQRVPGTPLPRAEIELAKSNVDTGAPAVAATEGVGERAAAHGRARPDRGAGQARKGLGKVGRDVEAAVAEAGDTVRCAVPEEEDHGVTVWRHSKPSNCGWPM